MQSIRTKSRPSLRIRNSEPVEPVQMNILYQSNIYSKKVCWTHFDDELRVQESQQVKNQESNISTFIACLIFPSSSLEMTSNILKEDIKGNRLKKQMKYRKDV